MMGRGIMVTKRTPANRKAFALLFPTYFSIISNVYGNISVSGYVHKSFDDFSSNNAQVTVIRKPLKGGIDTLFTSVDSYDYWSIYGGNYEPDLALGDTLDVYIIKNEESDNYTAKTKKLIEDLFNSTFLLELHLDNPDKSVKAFTHSIYRVIDTSNVSLPLIGMAKLNKNLFQNVDGVIDTSLYSWYQIFDAYFNLEQQDSMFSHGDSFTVRLEKRLVNQPTSDKDIVYFTEVKSAIDTTFWDAMKVNADNSIHNGAFHGDTLYFPMSVETINNGTALQQVSFAEPIIKGDTIILNYKCDNAVGYKILRKDNNQGDFKVISSTEKSQYKDVVPNGIYDYNLQALGNDGKVLNEQSFKVKKYGKEKCMSKVFYYGQKNLKEELKGREVYDITGTLINDVSRLPYGIYLIKDK